jgi:hypothetical protein
MEINLETNMHYLVHVENPGQYGGDTPVHVDTDGRDWAAMEAKQFPPSALLTSVRFLAWHALWRTAVTRRTWEQFNRNDCTQVDLPPADAAEPDDVDGEDEQGLDPGPTEANAAGGSTSQSRRGNRSKAPRGS